MPSFPTPEPVTLSIEVGAGTVDVTASPTDHTEVELRPARPGDRDAMSLIDQARIDLAGSTVFVHLPEGRRLGFLRRTPEVEVLITAPIGSSLEATLRSADLRGRGRFGTSRLESASGDIAVDEIGGDLRLDSASGDVRLDTVDGAARVKTASGDVQLDACGGDASVQSASGDVRLGDVAGSLEVKTASGDVVVDRVGDGIAVRSASGDLAVARIERGRADLTTMSGDVRVGVASGRRVWLDVSSVSGDVRSSLGDDAGDADAATSDQTDQIELAVHTVSGDVVITSDGRPAAL